ncbi:GNAT family N-acetyltransferase [Aureibacillus halotolerans]|uniref:RimJ/RimL family protein N-acetyltransferase n=1 Tax=Aureibacillus halotolerans TaxID=1508390 RepID=A0A4V3D665_9BACI|nr:GNAT family protein [Aureibacillus halotolerans]TDQ42747.1 RimJ/RimL family protein N-acetyltransferase [Aureibacillus halotolerans]
MFLGRSTRLDRFTAHDTELYHIWRNDAEVMSLTQTLLDSYSYEETERHVNGMLHQQDAKRYLIRDRETDQPIGLISLLQLDYVNANAECTIDIAEKSYWGKGYGRDAMDTLMRYAFDELRLHRLSLKVFSYNDRAIRLYEKLGFQVEGRHRDAIFRNGQYHDIFFMACLSSEFRRQ